MMCAKKIANKTCIFYRASRGFMELSAHDSIYILDLSVLVCYIYCLSCRYQLYGQWKSQSYYTQPELISARLSTLKKAKYIFSRLTKDNVKQQGRMIGKLSHANPTVFFEYVSTCLSFSST